MVLARVRGSVVATQKSEQLGGLKLLLLEKIDPRTMEGKKDFVVGIDGVGANVGEIVFYAGGSSARMTEVTKGKPTDATIVAIVDSIESEGDFVYRKSEAEEG